MNAMVIRRFKVQGMIASVLALLFAFGVFTFSTSDALAAAAPVMATQAASDCRPHQQKPACIHQCPLICQALTSRMEMVQTSSDVAIRIYPIRIVVLDGLLSGPEPPPPRRERASA